MKHVGHQRGPPGRGVSGPRSRDRAVDRGCGLGRAGELEAGLGVRGPGRESGRPGQGSGLRAEDLDTRPGRS